MTSTTEFFDDLSKAAEPPQAWTNVDLKGIWFELDKLPVESGRGFVLQNCSKSEELVKLSLELASNSWILEADTNFIFDESVNNKWKDAYKLL